MSPNNLTGARRGCRKANFTLCSLCALLLNLNWKILVVAPAALGSLRAPVKTGLGVLVAALLRWGPPRLNRIIGRTSPPDMTTTAPRPTSSVSATQLSALAGQLDG